MLRRLLVRSVRNSLESHVNKQNVLTRRRAPWFGSNNFKDVQITASNRIEDFSSCCRLLSTTSTSDVSVTNKDDVGAVNSRFSDYDLHLRWMSSGHPIEYQAISDQLRHILIDTNEKLSPETFYYLAKQYATRRAAGNAEKLVTLSLANFIRRDRLKEKLRDTRIFGVAMQAWVDSKAKFSGRNAEKILTMLERLIEENYLDIDVDVVKYNIAMKAYCIHADYENTKRVFDRCKRAYEIGNTQARPNDKTWNILLDACSKSGQPQLTENLAEEMYNEYKNGNEAVKPNQRVFNCVLDAWARSSSEKGAIRCETILNHMINLADDEDLPVRPDRFCYNTVISAYGRRGLPRDADRILQMMLEDYYTTGCGNMHVRPDQHSFDALIHGWAVSNEQDAGERAEAVLEQMFDLHENYVLEKRPTTQVYGAVIRAWINCGNIEKAREVSNRMVDAAKTDGYYKRIDMLSGFRQVLTAFYTTKRPDAGEVADEFLKHMEELEIEIQWNTMVTVLRCWECSLGHGHPEAKRRLEELESRIDTIKSRSSGRKKKKIKSR